jgi:hypothetical protein
MQHTSRAGGEKCMEVDHFNPNKKGDLIQDYKNLFLATRHCNGAKWDRWPSNKDRALGIRFLNCCEETDYGIHIFEDPDNHDVVGVTPQGKYHVRNCHLNARHLVEERALRAKLWEILKNKSVTLVGNAPLSLPVELSALIEVAAKMIPPIPYLSGQELEKHRARKLALAAIETAE